MTDKRYKKTIRACFTGYIVQAIVNNFVPLLFLTFHNDFSIPLKDVTFLITFNFGIQLTVDLISAKVIDKIGYRAGMIIADACSAAGLILLAVLPFVMKNPFAGLLVSVMVYAVGGGLTEVLVSPIMEACPTDSKESAMSLLHSFYCWGHVGVVLVSTLFFVAFGIENWRVLAALWAVVPIINLVSFTKAPIGSLIDEGETGLSFKELARKPLFWLLMLMMLCAGASEQAVSQWASTFAQTGLGVTKTLGDLFGPMMFAALMGISRALYGKYGSKIDLNRFTAVCAALCAVSYLVIVFSDSAVVGLVAFGFVGLCVGIFWPGTFSMGAAGIKNGSTMMFALFALAGDLGCVSGPTLAGITAAVNGDDLRTGIAAAVVFPALMLTGTFIYKKLKNAPDKNRSKG